MEVHMVQTTRERDESPAERARQDEAAVKAQAEALGAGMPAPGSTPTGTLTGAQAAEAKGEGTVKMNFPNAFTLTLDYGAPGIFFPVGINEVPRSLTDHPYVKANGATAV